MNNKEIHKCLSKLIDNCSINKQDQVCDNLQWKIEDCGLQDILFYNLKTDSDSVKKFEDRILKYHPSLLILNCCPQNIKRVCDWIVIKEGMFLEAQKTLCDCFYPYDKNLKKIVGITGTNGKTTTVHLALQVANKLGQKAFSIGTTGIFVADKGTVAKVYDVGLTTPPYIEIRKLFHKYFKEYDVCFMEVSSHALSQKRVYKIEFDAAGWLSFSQDHLDYHKKMQDYFLSKELIIKEHLKSKAKLFVPYSQTDLFEKLKNNKNVEVSPNTKKIVHKDEFFSPQFNKDNLEVAVAVNELILKKKIDIEKYVFQHPEGRFQISKIKGASVVVDYAHTPDALENLCKSIKNTFKGKEFILIFGCGGDRDKKKRSLMGEIALNYANKIIVTSDNSRFENPEKIIDDICENLDANKIIRISNRKDALRKGYEILDNKKVLVIAGKGHETYQVVKDKKSKFNDLEILKELESCDD